MYRRPWHHGLLFATAFTLVACAGDARRPLGESCSRDGDCISGLCAESVCLDPELDEDGDGLTNGFEAQLGSNPLLADSDEDGVDDAAELTGTLEPVDGDGDGLPDIVESRTADDDGDCITNQFDAQNAVRSRDLSPMRDVVCNLVGLCDAQRDALRVVCPVDVAQCVYDGVEGWVAIEATCDGVDENCDGEADEGFPDLDGDAIADCVDADADGDEVTDLRDNCPGLANTAHSDSGQAGDLIEVTLGSSVAFHTTSFGLGGTDIAAGDVDGDGRQDQIIALTSGLYFQASQGGFLGDEQAVLPRRVVAGNLDFQGGDEAVVLDPDRGLVRIYFYQEDIGDIVPVDLTVCAGGIGTDVALVDLGGDYQDILVACDRTNGSTFERWVLTGVWEKSDEVPLPDRAGPLAVADLDLDGTLELVVGTSDNLVVFELGASFMEVQRIASPSISALALGDLNRDAAGDVVVVTDVGAVHVYPGQLSGPLLSPSATVVTAITANDVKIGDLDHDGFQDLALSSSSGGTGITVLGGHGDFTDFTELRGVATPNQATRLELAGDRLLFVDDSGFYSWGDAKVTPAPRCGFDNETVMVTPPRLGPARFVRSGDLDQDGRLDLLAAGDGEGGLWLALGRGDGGFFADHLQLGGDGARDAQIGDIDGDGSDDVVVRYDDRIEALRNIGAEGAPSFAQIGLFSTSIDSVMTLADLDGDQRVDIVFSDPDGLVKIAYADVAVADNQQFTFVMTPISDPAQLVAANLDDRGDLDLLYVGGIGSQQVSVCRVLAKDQSPRVYEADDCAVAGVDVSANDIPSMRVDGLVVERSSADYARAFYRVSSDAGAPYIESLVVRGGATLAAVAVDMCSDGASGFGLGDFNPLLTQYLDDSLQDVGALCMGGVDLPDIGLATRSNATNDSAIVQSGEVDVQLGDAQAMTVADFDGNGLSDVATAHAVVPFVQAAANSSLLATRAAKVTDDALEPVDVKIADVTGDGVADIVSLTLERRQLASDNPGVYLRVRVSSPFVSAQLDHTVSITLCSGTDCVLAWEVHLAIGDVSGDLRPDIVVTHGSAAANAKLVAYRVARDGALSPLTFAIDTLETLPFLPEVLLLGDVFPDARGSVDLVLAGQGQMRVAVQEYRWSTDLNIIPVFNEVDVGIVPSNITAAFIGDFDPNVSGRQIAFYSQDDLQVSLVELGSCDVEHPDCASLVTRFDVFDGSSGGAYTIEGIAAGRLSNNLDTFAVTVVQNVVDGTRQLLQHVQYDDGAGQWISETIDARNYNSGFAVEPNLGPFIVDADRDGLQDIVMPWQEGRVWLIYSQAPHFDSRIIFGGLTDVRGARAVFGDVDGNQLPDALVFERSKANVHVINQGAPVQD